MSDHAISNARGWAATILEGMTALEALDEYQRGVEEEEAQEFDGEKYTDAQTLRDELQERPLSLQVRGGWYSTGNRDGFDAAPEEFEILLSTGGPALRIYGKLDGHGSIEGAPDLQWQDWGTPWTTIRDLSSEEDSAVTAFVGLFYFGD